MCELDEWLSNTDERRIRSDDRRGVAPFPGSIFEIARMSSRLSDGRARVRSGPFNAAYAKVIGRKVCYSVAELWCKIRRQAWLDAAANRPGHSGIAGVIQW